MIERRDRAHDRQPTVPVEPDLRTMRALITGASGFVGPHLTAHLQSVGDDVVGLDLGRGPDLRDHDSWIEVVTATRPDVIYHLAGWSDVGASWQDPWVTHEVNGLGTVTILEAARRLHRNHPTRVIVVSSADVYGIVEPGQSPIGEQHPARPHSPYGASKRSAEEAALGYWRGFELPVVLTRPFNHLGPGQSARFAAPAWANQIALIEQAHQSDGTTTGTLDPVVLHGDLTPRRDITDVRDVVTAYRLLAVHGEPGGTYNICSGRAVSMQTVFDTLVGHSTVEIADRVDPELLRPVEIPELLGDNAMLRSTTGWQPAFTLEQTLVDVLDDARRRVGVRHEPTAD